MRLYRWTLHFASAVGVVAALAGTTSLVYWAEAGTMLWHYAAGGGALIASGLAATICALLLESAEAELLRLRHERDITVAERDAMRGRMKGLERRAESLTLVREIHRSTNIVARGERLRQILSVIGQLGNRVEATLYSSAERMPGVTGLHPAAYLKTDGSGDAFIRFDRAPSDEAGLTISEVSSARVGARTEFTGELLVESERVGRIEVVLNGVQKGKPEEILSDMLETADLDCSAAGAALEHRQVLRYQDPSSNYCELLYPLAAEGKPVGVLRVRLPDQNATGSGSCGSGRDIADIEEILTECARHVALALKKEADVDRAEIDGLTGLLMKREFEPRLAEALRVGHEEKRPVALLVTDIDHFKKVNDTYGHRTGDIILRGVASLMRRHVRSCDSAFRYGGEELCVTLPGSGVKEAKATAERLREAVEAAVFTGDRGQEVRVTISIGLAAYDPKRAKARAEKARDPAELFRRADSAVYSAKEGGRNRVVAWGSRSKAKSAAKSTASSTRTQVKTPAKPRKSLRRTKSSRKAGPGTTASGRTLQAEFNPEAASSQIKRSA